MAPTKIEAGQSLLHYRLIDKIGEGGMGVVWRALDTQLDREVAIKLLPGALSTDSARLTRFEREAKLLASLNHPRIASIYGLHETEGIRFLAMELIEGEDLSRRLARGALTQDDALTIAAQVAEALEAAHDSGVIHRDLKPANILIDPTGAATVLDFGLAKAIGGGAGSDKFDPENSPTETSGGTVAGAILGTAAYMSPEQAAGRPVDKRTDIWAFGCVLYEMLSGSRLFGGSSVAETLAAVLKEAPDWNRLPAETSAPIRRLLHRCLVRDPRDRLRDIGDARIALRETRDSPSMHTAADAVSDDDTPSIFRRLAPWALVGLLALLLAFNMLGGLNAERPGSPVRLSMLFPETRRAFFPNGDLEMMSSFAITPTGDRVIYTVRNAEMHALQRGARSLDVRALGDFDAQTLRGTEDAEGPFVSPDGQWVGYFDGDGLHKVPIAGGAPIALAAGLGNGNGAGWTRDGRIVFSHSYEKPLLIVSDGGGTPQPLTTFAENERSHRYPQILPDGKSVLFTIKSEGLSSFDDAQIGVADLATGEHRVLAERGTYARYVESGHLLFARDRALMAAPFDLATLQTTGGAVPVIENLLVSPITGTAYYDVADDGTLIYVEGDFGAGPISLYAIDVESGTRRRLAEEYFALSPSLSPDGRQLVLHGPAVNDLILLLDLERGTVEKVTEPSYNNFLPIWGPGKSNITFVNQSSGKEAIVTMPAAGGPMESLVSLDGRRISASSWSRDGKRLAINVGLGSTRDIWVFDSETGKAEPFITTEYDEGDAVFSADGRWLAYSSDETGETQIHAAPFPGPGRSVQLTTDGGVRPRWRDDSREIYYQWKDGLLALPLQKPLQTNGALRPGTPRTLLTLESEVPIGWDASADGKTFYVVELDETRWEARSLNVVLGWGAELRAIE